MFQLQCSAVCYRIRCYLAPFCCSNLNSNITLLVTKEEQMAPRGRSRAGNTRMDAAIDALTPMGFSPPQIRRKVKDLLEVYGGREGWAFIEEASYKLLIETLLEDQDSEKPEEPKLLEYRASETAGEPLFEDQQQNETRTQGADAETSEPGLFDLAIRPSCSEQGSVHSSPEAAALEPPAHPALATENSGLLKDQPEIDMADIQRQIALILLEAQETPPGFEQLARQQGSGPAPGRRRRKPCLGWIGPKDDDDFVLLEPMPVEGQQERRKSRGKLKSRWDEKPLSVE